ncbi:MAG: HAD family hydrolase [Cyanobacteria bacterium J083]|nr:MAG: HAD family hydrolase [Cyanobacteria bacterium J083]
MAIKLIIFDFDGTLADSFEILVKISNKLAPEFGYAPISPTESHKLKNLSSRAIVKESKISPLKLPFLLRRVQKELQQYQDHIASIPGITQALFHLKEQGYRLGIITSNSSKNVNNFLQKNSLTTLFDFVHSEINIFGKHRIIDKVLKQLNLAPTEAIYVGDETRDIKAAKRSKVHTLAVGWGFNSPDILSQYQPDFLIKHPQALSEVLALANRKSS